MISQKAVLENCQSAGYPLRISASKTAVAVELHLVEPILSPGQALNRQRIHGFDEANLGRSEGIEVL